MGRLPPREAQFPEVSAGKVLIRGQMSHAFSGRNRRIDQAEWRNPRAQIGVRIHEKETGPPCFPKFNHAIGQALPKILCGPDFLNPGFAHIRFSSMIPGGEEDPEGGDPIRPQTTGIRSIRVLRKPFRGQGKVCPVQGV